MTARAQAFEVGRERSTTFAVICSILQGSVLGPLKFIADTEDLPALIERRCVYPYLYADDDQLNVHLWIQDVNAALQNMETCVDDVQNWCASKRLQVNLKLFGLVQATVSRSWVKPICVFISIRIPSHQLNLFETLVFFLITNKECQPTSTRSVASVFTSYDV